MIRAVFMQGGNIRKMLVTRNTVTMVCTETNFEPIEIRLDEMIKPENIERIKGGMGWVKDIKKLKNEWEMFEDIKRDFKKSGWRLLIRKEMENA